MDTTRRELIENTALELFEYIKSTYCVEVDIPDVQSIIDNNIGFAIDAAYEGDVSEEN